MKKMVTILLLLLSIGVVLNGMWYETCDIFYPAQCTGGDAPTLMVDGTSALLEAQLHFIAAVNLVQQGDLNGVDMNKLKYRINTAVDKIELAQQSFEDLSEITETLSVNSYYLNLLQNFDYQTFGNQKGYLSEIYEIVEELLSDGDVSGTIVLTNQSSAAILERFQAIQTVVDEDLVPSRADMHEANQALMEAILFSQYVADVCADIKNN